MINLTFIDYIFMISIAIICGIALFVIGLMFGYTYPKEKKEEKDVRKNKK